MNDKYKIVKHVFGKHNNLTTVFMSNLSEEEARNKASHLNKHRLSNRTYYGIEKDEVTNQLLKLGEEQHNA